MNRIIYLLPVLTLCALAYLQVQAIIDERTITLISEPTPYFDIEEMSFMASGEKRITSDNIKDYIHDDVTMVNFFASWCLTCLIEHDQLMELAKKHKLHIIGIAYKDKPRDINKFMTRHGNPYTHIGMDEDGYAGAGWRISGTPESFIIDYAGSVRYNLKGPIRKNSIARILQIIDAVRKDMPKEGNKI